jgi:purine-nucleoside phosphorylase
MVSTSPVMVSAHAAAECIASHYNVSFDAIVVTGSGFVLPTGHSDHGADLPYAQVPGMPQGCVAGHEHVFRFLRIGDRFALICSGRFHRYEGLTADACGIFVDIASALKCRRVVLTNAVGALNPSLNVGSLVVVHDTLDLTGQRVLCSAGSRSGKGLGGNWHADLMQRCRQRGHHLHEGVLAQMLGPTYETRAEVRMLRRMGADVVGMSTVTEARRALTRGLDTTVLSLVTNTLSDVVLPMLSHDDVMQAARAANATLADVVLTALE